MRKPIKLRDKLKARYKKKIEQLDWEKIRAECEENPQLVDDFVIGSTYIGSQMSLFPSGKYYAFWTTNQNKQDVIRDQAFAEALAEVCEENGFSPERGEGDPTDIYVTAIIGSNDDVFYIQQHDTFWYQNKKIAETEEWLKKWMEDEQYWPSVWSVSDHGNVSRYEFDE